MSEPTFPSPAGGLGGPMGRPDGNGLPPGAGGGLTPPNGDDSRDPGVDGGTGDIGEDTGGLAPDV